MAYALTKYAVCIPLSNMREIKNKKGIKHNGLLTGSIPVMLSNFKTKKDERSKKHHLECETKLP
jgi:hypothetical protein